MQRRLLVTGTLVALCCAAGTARAATAPAMPGPDRNASAVVAPARCDCSAAAGCGRQNERLTDEQRYIDWVVCATPEELVATFGRGTP